MQSGFTEAPHHVDVITCLLHSKTQNFGFGRLSENGDLSAISVPPGERYRKLEHISRATMVTIAGLRCRVFLVTMFDDLGINIPVAVAEL